MLDVYRFDVDRFRVNKILAPDTTPLHRHPWAFCWGQIMSGGYVHEYATLGADGKMGPVQDREFLQGAVNFMPYSMWHRIKSVLPDTFTLFFWGPAVDNDSCLDYWTDAGPVSACDWRAE